VLTLIRGRAGVYGVVNLDAVSLGDCPNLRNGQRVRQLAAEADANTLTGFSCSFNPRHCRTIRESTGDGWERILVTEITSAAIVEISVVTNGYAPAYASTWCRRNDAVAVERFDLEQRVGVSARHIQRW